MKKCVINPIHIILQFDTSFIEFGQLEQQIYTIQKIQTPKSMLIFAISYTLTIKQQLVSGGF